MKCQSTTMAATENKRHLLQKKNKTGRFYDTTEGEVLVGGHNVREYTLAQLAPIFPLRS